MSDNTDPQNGSPEENQLIRGLRADLNDALKAVKTAGADAVAKVKRGQTASTLMPKGFEGFADVFEADVDGELTAESAAEWLKGRGFTASSDEAEKEAVEAAVELEKVTDLGGAVAAAGNLTPEDSQITALGEVVTPGKFQSLDDVAAGVDKILNG